ncbi:MAG: 3-isopropylmalate dehydratase large subunit [Firmicutes bacterium]|nr:3-isopropylmalate dehydratase large subunit [Bacillota bacterium]
MPMTMTQKILAEHAGKQSVKAGELIVAKIDRVLGNDITAPVAIEEFRKIKGAKPFDKNKITLVMDHFAPNKDIKAAEQCKTCREFAGEHSLPHFYDGGEMGIEHALLPEKGLVTAGDIVIGADSHTCTYGGLGAFSTGVGSTDMAAGMATGKAWFKVPAGIKVVLTGKLVGQALAKDVILTLIGKIGVDGALYKSLEFVGEGCATLSVTDRLTICNMAIEAGAKNGIFGVDKKTIDYLKEAGAVVPKIFVADDDAVYDEVVEINLSAVKPVVAFPHLPENVHEVSKIDQIKIDQVVIGSCTNGFLSDMQVAAKILRGKKVAKGVRCIIFPSTPKIYLDALKAGYLQIFVESGAQVSPPTCGPCLGGHMGILAKGERCVATTNRNFVGRMGHPESEVYLSSPAVAAASAIAGYITEP